MTQIVSHLCRAFVLQVADRLATTKQVGRPSEPFDGLANKKILDVSLACRPN